MTSEEMERVVADCRRLGITRWENKKTGMVLDIGPEPPKPADPSLCVHGEPMGEVICKLCEAMNRPIRNPYQDPSLGAPRMKRNHV